MALASGLTAADPQEPPIMKMEWPETAPMREIPEPPRTIQKPTAEQIEANRQILENMRRHFMEQVEAGKATMYSDQELDEQWQNRAHHSPGSDRITAWSIMHWDGKEARQVPSHYRLRVWYTDAVRTGTLSQRGQPRCSWYWEAPGLPYPITGWEIRIFPEDPTLAPVRAFAGDGVPPGQEEHASSLRVIWTRTVRLPLRTIAEVERNQVERLRPLGIENWPSHYPPEEWRGLVLIHNPIVN